MSTSSTVPDGHYRIRQAGAKSQIANSISNGKKCHYVQIGIELTAFGSLEDALEFVDGKDLKADSLSLDFGAKPPQPEPEDSPVESDDENADATESEASD